jgi:hypothetical protein
MVKRKQVPTLKKSVRSTKKVAKKQTRTLKKSVRPTKKVAKKRLIKRGKKSSVFLNKDFLRLLLNTNSKQRKQLIRIASRDQILCICECAFNIARRNIPLTKGQVKNLRKNPRVVYKLADRSVKFGEKKKTLEQSGGFLPLLLAPIFTTVLAEAVEALQENYKNE